MTETISVNGKDYEIERLLGKGKGGYSYLAKKDGREFVLKQIHHEPCSYYQFGNKIQSEIDDYKRLSSIGIKMPVMIDADIINIIFFFISTVISSNFLVNIIPHSSK